MPSSISNSKKYGWGKSWFVALAVTLFLLCTLESYWRINGHKPNIVDDQRLWSIERSKIGKSEKELVLLGSSRMQTDISIETLNSIFPDYSIINLAADGTCANAALFDLAKEDKFKGKVIVEITPECLLFGGDKDISQQFYIDYFHNSFNLNERLNRGIATSIQDNIVVIDPYLNLIKVAGKLIVEKKYQTPNYVTTYENRTRAADYSKSNISQQKIERIKHAEERYRQLSSRITTHLIKHQITSLNEAVKMIFQRGGKIVFVRYPVSDEHYNMSEQYFPRPIYWDCIIQAISAKVVHFKDIEEMNLLECPDASHIDFRDKEKFTNTLAKELINMGII